jgi:hypothetical protein
MDGWHDREARISWAKWLKSLWYVGDRGMPFGRRRGDSDAGSRVSSSNSSYSSSCSAEFPSSWSWWCGVVSFDMLAPSSVRDGGIGILGPG